MNDAKPPTGDYDGVELTPWTPSYKAPPKPPREPKKRGRKTNVALGLPPPVKLNPAEMRADCRAVFGKALAAWLEHDDCPLDALQEVGENAYLADFKENGKGRRRPRAQQNTISSKEWGRLAELLPGKINPMPDNTGCTWQRGGGGTRGWLLTSRSNLQAVLSAQATLVDTIPASDRPDLLLPFTTGAVARYMLGWVGLRQHCFKATEALLRHPDGYAFRRAVPGVYPEPYVYWDAAAYYYTIISRLKCPLISVSKKKVMFQRIDAEQRERWQMILAAVGENKGLRNALHGAMQGSYRQLQSFSKNYPGGFLSRGNPGLLRPAALLVVRAGHELTQLENLGGGSIWGHTDCAVLPLGVEPTIWRSKGIAVEQKASGPAHIIDKASYRVGARVGGVYKLWVNKDGTPKEGLLPYYDAENDAQVQPGEAAEGRTFPDVQYHSFFL